MRTISVVRSYSSMTDSNTLRCKDTLDISLVNGFNYPMQIPQFDKNDVNFSKGRTVAKADKEKNNQKELNVYPLSCDVCDKIVAPPTPPFFPNCTAQKDWDQTQCKQAGDPPCHTGYSVGFNYKVDIR